MIKEFNLTGVHNKWLELMNYIRHSTPMVYQLMFTDKAATDRAQARIRLVIERNPTWFEVEIVRKGHNLYIIKKDHIQKAVIKDVI